jgi:hypothetical protein
VIDLHSKIDYNDYPDIKDNFDHLTNSMVGVGLVRVCGTILK